MDPQQLIDPAAAGFVVLGTAAVTFARTGWRDSRITLRHIAGLLRRPFNLQQQRAELAREVEQMRHDGVLRGQLDQISDPEFADATAALIRHRSTAALEVEHQRHRLEREAHRAAAIEALDRAGELAPVLGLAGTLLALSQLPGADLASEGAVMRTVSMAVVSTFYGLALAHLLCHPLASAIERHGRAEEEQRSALAQWLVSQLEPACPRLRATSKDGP